MSIKNHLKKRVNPFVGILLFLISVLFIILTGPLGILFGSFYQLYKKSISGLGIYCLKIAVSIDQLGNVVMKDLFNTLFVQKGAYSFGNRDETISSVIGKNIELKKLSKAGRCLNFVLNKIEMGHSLNSIDYFVEPDENRT